MTTFNYVGSVWICNYIFIRNLINLVLNHSIEYGCYLSRCCKGSMITAGVASCTD